MLWRVYRQWVVDHPGQVTALEEVLSTLTLFLTPSRLRGDSLDTKAEVVFTSVGLLSLLHSSILESHHKDQRKLAVHCGVSEKSDSIDYGLLTGLRIIKSLEILLELITLQRPSSIANVNGTSHQSVTSTAGGGLLRWRTIWIIEYCKALLRLLRLFRCSGRRLCVESTPLKASAIIAQNASSAVTPSGEVRHTYIGKRSGRPLPSIRPPPQIPTLATCDELSRNSHSKRFLFIADLLRLLRPLIYLYVLGKLRRRAGIVTVVPWLISLALDLASHWCTTRGSPLTEPEQEEVSRRFSDFSLYLIRSPVYATVSRPVLERLCYILSYIPVVGFFASHTVEIVDGLQHAYFYTS